MARVIKPNRTAGQLDRSSSTISAISASACSDLLLGNRIPRDYFITSGIGESDITVHAGSYHLALHEAGIEMCNIMTYSSILPGIATEIERPENLVHGSVMESIMAVSHSRKGKRATAGIGYGWLRRRDSGDRYGGLVCEHTGGCTESTIRKRLIASLDELYDTSFADDYLLNDITLLTRSIVPEKKYGTALVALCFTSYLFPVKQEHTNPDSAALEGLS